MVVLANESDMISDSDSQKNNTCHEFSVYVDRQLQNKLLQIEEESDIGSYENKLSNSLTTLRNGAKTTKTDDISGWYSDAKFAARKNDCAIKNDTKPANTFLYPWKDRGIKKEGSFVFKHYIENKKYIEQYRSEHGCLNNRYSLGNQNVDNQKVVFQPSLQPAHGPVTLQQIQQNWASHNVPLTLHYANRGKEQSVNLISLSTPVSSNCYDLKPNPVDLQPSSHHHRYRFTPGQLARTITCSEIKAHDEYEHSTECWDYRKTPSRRSNSASSTRSRIKAPTKISVPANSRAYPIHALTIQQNGKQDVCPSPRPLDNLKCVAPEKQKQLHSHPELDGLTWSEKLEVLRSINKPVVKPKPKQLKLKFIKEDQNDLLVWSTEPESLYEQRHIQHLVQQARMKGGNQYDWVYEAQVRARKIEWGTSKIIEGTTENQELIQMNENSSDYGDVNFNLEDECV